MDSRDDAASSLRRGRHGKLAWVELLVEDDRAADFVQTLASGDPDVAVLPTPQAAATTGAGR